MADKNRILYHSGYLPIDRKDNSKLINVANFWLAEEQKQKVMLFSKRLGDMEYQYFAYPIVKDEKKHIAFSRRLSIPWSTLNIDQEFLVSKKLMSYGDDSRLFKCASKLGKTWNKTFHVREAENHFLIKRLS